MEDRLFNADELQVLLGAFRQACADVGPVDDLTRSRIAYRILARAREGERDPEILRTCATTGLVVRAPALRRPDSATGGSGEIADSMTWKAKRKSSGSPRAPPRDPAARAMARR